MANPKTEHVSLYRGRGHKPRGDIALEQLTPLLYTRRQAARLLNTSVATVIRLEQRGILTPRKLYQAQNGMTYYAREDLVRLARGGDDGRS